MSDFSIHNEDNHPEHAAEVIGAVREKYGFVPNLLGALSESPAAVQAYLSLGEALRESSFTPEERHVVWFTINALHECRYCMAAHTGIARSEKISEQVIETARAGTDYADPKLQALKVFTTRMVLERGWVEKTDIDAFLDAGHTRRTVFDVILAISHKVLSNYTNHVVETPVDPRFAAFEWAPARQAAE